MSGEQFWGRIHLLDEIQRGVWSPLPTSFSLVGARLSGKSTLLRHLASKSGALLCSSHASGVSSSSPSGLRPVVLWLDCAWLNDQFDLLDVVQATLRQQLKQETYDSLNWSRILAPADSFQRLGQLAWQLQPIQVRLVILLDNFDALWNNGSLQLNVAESLRHLTSLTTLVLASALPLYELDERLVGSMRLGAATQLFLGLLEADAVQQWLADYVQNYPGLSAFAALLPDMTGGHPFLLRKLGDSLAEVQQMLAPGQPWRSQHAPLLRLRLAEYGYPLFVALWRTLEQLPPGRQTLIFGLLARLARAPLPPEQITPEQVPALNWLINQATIRYGITRDSYTFQLFSPLFAEFVLSRRTLPITGLEELAVQQANNGPTHNAEEAIYEQLTKMEAILLRYFERHSQKLIPMEQLLTDVWKRSDTSTRRVQEAIRRLRLQLEQNPAIGMIENERGRGYRFIPAR